jgi:hypothetical protein
MVLKRRQLLLVCSAGVSAIIALETAMTPKPQAKHCITPAAVEAILHEVSNTVPPHPGLNERYIHHLVTHRLQSRFACLELAEPHDLLALHPEWPTVKRSSRISYAKYRKVSGRYLPVELEKEGSAGFIDFASGYYSAPDIGVELSLKKGWCHEEVTYDFLKLIDRRNPFKVAFSHNLIIRENNLARGTSRQDLEDHINAALQEAIGRLKPIGCAETRDLRFMVSEIATHERAHWHYDPASGRFIAGLT